MKDGSARYDINRRMGVIDRAVNLPFDPRTNDKHAASAELAFATRYGLPKPKHNGPDKGYDFVINGQTIDVKWSPRPDARLLHRISGKGHADYYVLMVGMDFRLAGWVSGRVLRSSIMDLGYGPTYALAQSQLSSDVDYLVDQLRSKHG